MLIESLEPRRLLAAAAPVTLAGYTVDAITQGGAFQLKFDVGTVAVRAFSLSGNPGEPADFTAPTTLRYTYSRSSGPAAELDLPAGTFGLAASTKLAFASRTSGFLASSDSTGISESGAFLLEDGTAPALPSTLAGQRYVASVYSGSTAAGYVLTGGSFNLGFSAHGFTAGGWALARGIPGATGSVPAIAGSYTFSPIDARSGRLELIGGRSDLVGQIVWFSQTQGIYESTDSITLAQQFGVFTPAGQYPPLVDNGTVVIGGRITSASVFHTGRVATVTTIVQNSGTTLVPNVPITIDLFATTGNAIDSNAVKIASTTITLNIPPRATVRAVVQRFTVNLPPGKYTIASQITLSGWLANGVFRDGFVTVE